MNGIVIINKEKNYTSNDVVKKVKKILNTKVGHTGTLDPNATGVLPLLLGDATKISKYLINHNKAYNAVLKLGIKTQTADGEGDIIEEIKVDNKLLNEELIKKVLYSFKGKQMQLPPMYSAIKVNGKKLYEYAREGKTVKITPREIEIYDIELINIDYKEKEINFNVKCSKGTYIRSLCENIAERLGTIGYMKDLDRISVGDFSIDNAIKISDLENQIKNNDFSSIITIEHIFKNNKKIILNKDNINKYLNGVKIEVNVPDDGIYRIYMNDNFIGIGIVMNSKLKRDLVIT